MSRKLVVIAALSIDCGPKQPSITLPAPAAIATFAGEPEPPAAAPAALEPPQPALRLPRNFVPTGYTARLAIDPSKPGFTGAIAIAGAVSERSSLLWLHGRGLAISRAVARRDGVELPVTVTVTPRGGDLLELRPETPLDAGAWTIALDYAGTFDLVNTIGAFKQTVAEQPYVFTQFEAIYARRVFPCFDEPDNKVPWKLTLDVPKQLVAVANTPIASETALDAATRRVEFAVSRPLPSYLVAFGVGPFDVVDAGRTAAGTPVRILTSARRAAEATYAARTTPRMLEHVEEWFGTPYPYEKLDVLSIPITVGFGAMENAGLITFNESLMLMDAQRPARFRQHDWVEIAAHEIAHQWFGDLVTMAWWDDIWLNEGFANWLQYKISARIDPSWRDEHSPLGMRNRALEADSLVSARRIRQPIATTDDIFNVFDGITYNKGASVLHMFESYLGPDVFQRGVRAYMAKHAWGNATSADFAAAIAAASGKDVGAAFASFLDQAGAPEIAATLRCAGGKATVELTQRRYLRPGAPAPEPTAPWQVPVCVAYDKAGARGEACALMTAASGAIELATAACPRWVMPNANGRGFYRNTHTTAQLAALRDEAWPKLSWSERRVIHFDVVDAVATGKLPLQLALSFVPKLLAGNDRFTVGPALGLPSRLDGWVPDELRDRYEHWLRTTFGPGASKVGLVPKDGDSLDVEVTRAQLITTVAWRARDPALVGEAVRMAERWRELPQAIRSVVLAIAVDARSDVFERALREVAGEPDRMRRDDMMWALAGVRDPARQRAALGLIVEPKLDIRETLWMLYGSSTEANRRVAQQFFRDHHAQIMARVPHDETAGQLAALSEVFTATCRADQRDAIADYVTATFSKLPGGTRMVAQNIEAMDQCIARRRLLEPEIRAWLGGVKLPRPKP